MVSTNLLGFVFLYSSDQPEPSLHGMVKSMTVSFRAVTLCTIVGLGQYSVLFIAAFYEYRLSESIHAKMVELHN